MQNNIVELSGVIVSDFKFDHECEGEKFYSLQIKVNRLSKVSDYITLLMSDRIICVKENILGKYVNVIGSMRTYNWKDDDKNHLKISVFVEGMDVIDVYGDTIDLNSVSLDGYICKNLGNRSTPLGRNICDVMLAVNRPYGKSDYIPCIIWGKNANYVSNLSIGTKLHICGRLQSRTYLKDQEERTAYEVSVQTLKLLGDEESH